jgi:hypothetical protein
MTRELAAVLICTASIGVLAIGCAVHGQPFEKVSPPPAHAVIYVYRPYAYGSSALRPNVTCGEDSVRIGPGGYHAFMVPLGQKVVCSMHTDNADEVEIKTDARVYYIREELGWGLLTGQPHLNPVDNDKAQTEIQSCVEEQQAPPSQQVQ